MNSKQNATIRVDRHALAKIRSSRAMTDAVAEMAIALRGIWNTDELLGTLLDRIVEQIPAQRGVVMIPGNDGRDLKAAVFHGNPFNADRELCTRAYRDSEAALKHSSGGSSLLCAPLWMDGVNAGAVYIDKTRGSLTQEQFHLFIALAAQAAWRLEYTRRLDVLQAQKQQSSEYRGVAKGIVGNSPAFVNLRDLIARVARTRTTILILGERGTGKELVALAIHELGRGKDTPFMPINCAAIPSDLLESLLFGHEKGAFTGAVERKIGLLEMADGGTVFLDEIGELPLPMQAKLLRALQEREFQRVGGKETIKVNIRVIAATNRDLKQAVKNGTFRADLLDRLEVIPLRTPALREVPGDIPPLVQRFIEDLEWIIVVKGISPEALEALTRYHWPGNARQLRNVIEYALHFAEPGGWIEKKHLPDVVWEGTQDDAHRSTEEPRRLKRKAAPPTEAEIVEALRKTGGNVTKAAPLVGKSLRQMWRLIREFGIERP